MIGQVRLNSPPGHLIDNFEQRLRALLGDVKPPPFIQPGPPRDFYNPSALAQNAATSAMAARIAGQTAAANLRNQFLPQLASYRQKWQADRASQAFNAIQQAQQLQQAANALHRQRLQALLSFLSSLGVGI
jgi:hypothetical protein